MEGQHTTAISLIECHFKLFVFCKRKLLERKHSVFTTHATHLHHLMIGTKRLKHLLLNGSALCHLLIYYLESGKMHSIKAHSTSNELILIIQQMLTRLFSKIEGVSKLIYPLFYSPFTLSTT